MSVTLVPSGGETRSDHQEQWSARGRDVASQLASWSRILETTHLHFEVSPSEWTPERFHGGVVRRAMDGIMLVDCVSVPFRGCRDSATVGVAGPIPAEDVIGFQFLRKGVETARECDTGREMTLCPGSIALWDGLQPTDIEIVKPFHKRTLLFPRQRVTAISPRLAERAPLPALEASGPARLLVRYMNALAIEMPGLDDAGLVAAANVSLELLRAAVEPELPSDRVAERVALRTDIRRYIRTHLQDPELGPTTIAAANAMSLRALHALFQDGDESVAVIVRNERLQRCMEDLQRPSAGSVTEIAFRWGFCETAHFSRVFKRRFDVTPSEVRHLARLGARGSSTAPDSPSTDRQGGQRAMAGAGWSRRID